MNGNDLSVPVLLTREHALSTFDCGKAPLNEFLQRHALQNQAGGSARTYVVTPKGQNCVVAYYSLTPGSVDIEDTPERIRKGQPRHPVPIILMARFAVDMTEQGKGHGASLFNHALSRAVAGYEIVGGRAFVVHAKDESAMAFYLRFGMEPSPSNPLHLFPLFKDIMKVLERPT
jgi:hypothetical protein